MHPHRYRLGSGTQGRGSRGACRLRTRDVVIRLRIRRRRVWALSAVGPEAPCLVDTGRYGLYSRTLARGRQHCLERRAGGVGRMGLRNLVGGTRRSMRGGGGGLGGDRWSGRDDRGLWVIVEVAGIGSEWLRERLLGSLLFGGMGGVSG